MTFTGISFESVVRQNTDFLNDLTSAVGRFRKEADYTAAGVKKSHIIQVIKQYTNISVSPIIDRSTGASIYPPYMTSNHVFLRGSQSASVVTDITKIAIVGRVDPVKARVEGSFADVVSVMTIGTGLLEPGFMTDDEIAAIILHELGHVFTCWQFMSTIAYGGLVIGQTVNNIFLSDNYQTKKIHIQAAEELLGIDFIADHSNWIDTNKENVEIIMNTRLMRHMRSRTMTGLYDVRNCEQLADTFAAKHGAAVPLARGLDKIFKKYGMYGNPNPFVNILSQTTMLLKVIMPFSGRSLSRILLTLDQPKRYDDPVDRMAFVRFQLIDDLKRIPSGNKKLREDITESIKDVTDLMAGVKERKNIFIKIHESFTVNGRSRKQQTDKIKELETLLYNDLFLQSAKFKNLH